MESTIVGILQTPPSEQRRKCSRCDSALYDSPSKAFKAFEGILKNSLRRSRNPKLIHVPPQQVGRYETIHLMKDPVANNDRIHDLGAVDRDAAVLLAAQPEQPARHGPPHGHFATDRDDAARFEQLVGRHDFVNDVVSPDTFGAFRIAHIRQLLAAFLAEAGKGGVIDGKDGEAFVAAAQRLPHAVVGLQQRAHGGVVFLQELFDAQDVGILGCGVAEACGAAHAGLLQLEAERCGRGQQDEQHGMAACAECRAGGDEWS
mmetsp:Transcript_346/g.952  ORF Transcript_346/g.952 Transcript_346/m.952 type:complete len:260 (+) Transcript_346:838-1617(+)